jgi:acetylornithine deacetylase/succinyl-diaminopimelate desuccinylase-like protein
VGEASAGPTVCLAAAADTAPPGEGWTTDPYGGAVAEGRIFGRGAANSKGDLACFLFAARALARALPEPAGRVELHVTFDDETGGFLGPQYLLAQEIVRPDIAIGAGETHGVCTRQGGCLQLDVLVRGRQAHATQTGAGKDALEAAMPVLSALYAERARLAALPPVEDGALAPSLTVGTIAGGAAANLVPERVTLRLDRRLTPAEDGEAVEAALVARVAQAAADAPGVEVECQRRLLVEPVTAMDRSSGLASLVRREAESVIGEAVPDVASAVLSGARFYAEAGIPTVGYGVGPRGSGGRGQPYGPDESVPLADLRAATLVVARTLAVLLRRP